MRWFEKRWLVIVSDRSSRILHIHRFWRRRSALRAAVRLEEKARVMVGTFYGTHGPLYEVEVCRAS